MNFVDEQIIGIDDENEKLYLNNVCGFEIQIFNGCLLTEGEINFKSVE